MSLARVSCGTTALEVDHCGHRDPRMVVAVLAHHPARRVADRSQGQVAGEAAEIVQVGQENVDRLDPERIGEVGESGDAHIRAHLQAGGSADLRHRGLAPDGVLVIFERKRGEALADPQRGGDGPARIGVDPEQRLRPEPIGQGLHGLELDVGGEDAPLELEDAEPPSVAEPRRHLGHRPGCPDLAPIVEGGAAVDEVGIGQDRRVVGGVAIEEVRRELHRRPDRAAEEVREPMPGGAAGGVEAGELDPGVAGRRERDQLSGESAIGEGVAADDDIPRPLDGPGRPLPADGLADADDPGVGRELDHVPEEVRPVAPDRGEQRGVGQRDRGDL